MDYRFYRCDECGEQLRLAIELTGATLDQFEQVPKEKAMNRGRFWMVLGSGTPTVRHPSKQSAKNEAERLARQNPGEEFVVLESLATVCVAEMQWQLNDVDGSVTSSDVPF